MILANVPTFNFRFQFCALYLYFGHLIFECNSKLSYICSAYLLSMEEIHSACQDSANGIPSRRPVIEMTIPSVLDKTISPPGTQLCLWGNCDIFFLLAFSSMSLNWWVLHTFCIFFTKIKEIGVEPQFWIHSRIVANLWKDVHQLIFLHSYPFSN